MRYDDVRQVRQRLAALSWLRGVMTQHPGGIVPVPTACRVLGVSSKRMRDLIAEGKVPVVEGMPGGGERDRFVPIDSLINLPIAANRGRPGVYGLDRKWHFERLNADLLPPGPKIPDSGDRKKRPPQSPRDRS